MNKFSKKFSEIYETYLREGKVKNKLEFGKLLGLSKTSIYAYLYGECIPGDEIKKQIVEKLGMRYEDLFEIDNSKNKASIDPKVLYEKIVSICKIYDITISHFCTLIKKSSSFPFKLKDGDYIPTIGDIEKICSVFKVTKEWLYESTDQIDKVAPKCFYRLSKSNKLYVLEIMRNLLGGDIDEQTLGKVKGDI